MPNDIEIAPVRASVTPARIIMLVDNKAPDKPATNAISETNASFTPNITGLIISERLLLFIINLENWLSCFVAFTNFMPM